MDEGLVPNVDAASCPNLIERTDPSPVFVARVSPPAFQIRRGWGHPRYSSLAAVHPLPCGEGDDSLLVAASPRRATPFLGFRRAETLVVSQFEVAWPSWP